MDKDGTDLVRLQTKILSGVLLDTTQNNEASVIGKMKLSMQTHYFLLTVNVACLKHQGA